MAEENEQRWRHSTARGGKDGAIELGAEHVAVVRYEELKSRDMPAQNPFWIYQALQAFIETLLQP